MRLVKPLRILLIPVSLVAIAIVIADVALAHSQDMRNRSFFDHTNPNGDRPFDRMAAVGITYRSAGHYWTHVFAGEPAVSP